MWQSHLSWNIGGNMDNQLNFKSLIENINRIDKQFIAETKKSINVNLTLRNWFIGAYIVFVNPKVHHLSIEKYTTLSKKIIAPSATFQFLWIDKNFHSYLLCRPYGLICLSLLPLLLGLGIFHPTFQMINLL